jgi:CRP/FNR family transcriptional regulator, nitrogen fixation regulation protein
MAERMAQVDVIDLPMSRQDIADYLGLTIETISRTLTQLETAAAISGRVGPGNCTPSRSQIRT